VTNAFGNQGTTTHKLDLDAKGYTNSIRNVTTANSAAEKSSKNLASSNGSLFKSFVDVKAGADTVFAAMTKVASAFDKAMTSGAAYGTVINNVTADLTLAKTATKGLIDDTTLMGAANRAAAFNLGLSSKGFADLAKAATIASQKLGTQGGAAKAIDDVITGLARKSPMILDNIGITVKASVANTNYAATLGKTASKLTDVEKGLAFNVEALRQLNKIAEGGTVVAKGFGGQWLKTKTILKDLKDAAFGAAAALGEKGEGQADGMTMAIKLATGYFKTLTIETKTASEAMIRAKGVFLASAREIALSLSKIPIFGQKFALIGGALGAQNAQNDADADVAAQRKRESDAAARYKAAMNMINKPGDTRPAATRRKGGGSNSIGEWNVGTQDDFLRAEFAKEQQRKAAALQRLKGQDFAASQQADKAAGSERYAERERALLQLKKQAIERERELAAAEKERWRQMGGMGIAALKGMTAATYDAAVAAIESGASFGQAMQQMLKATVMSVGKQAVIKALYASAEGFLALARWDLPAAGNAFTSAALFGAVGVAATAGGIAIPGASSSSSSSSVGANAGSSMGANSGLGRQSEQDKQPIVVNLRYDRESPAQAAVAALGLQAQVDRREMGFA